MNNPFSQSKVTYKIAFTTYFKNLNEFENIIDDIFEENMLGVSTSEISSQTIESLPQDIWLIEIYLSENPGLDFAKGAIGSAATLTSLAIIEEISIDEIEDADWVSIYHAGLKPIEIGDFFISSKIHQSDCPKDKIGIFVEASRAFGTGDHSTTSGCIEALIDIACFKFQNILDIGTGTGILSFAAKYLWQDARVIACDIEEVAVGIAQDNAITNGLNIEIYQNNENEILTNPYKAQKFGLIISNILAGPLINMASQIRAIVTDEAYIILAGFLESQAGNVQSNFEKCGFNLINLIVRDSWVILTMSVKAN